MFNIKSYPMIIIGLLIVLVGFVGWQTIIHNITIISALVILILAGVLGGLSITAVFGLFSHINSLSDTPDESPVLTSADIRQFYRACIKLDKYGVQYTIDINEKKIHAYVSMGLYTRMSVSDNLDPIVYYHIDGTDVILVKQSQ